MIAKIGELKRIYEEQPSKVTALAKRLPVLYRHLLLAQYYSDLAKRQKSQSYFHYKRKERHLEEVVKRLPKSGLNWGWGEDTVTFSDEGPHGEYETSEAVMYVLYVDLPTGQISFHSRTSFVGFDEEEKPYDGTWDKKRGFSVDRILSCCDAILTNRTTRFRLKSERGWTDKLLRLFLPSPKETKPNPRGGSPIFLFDVKEIEAIEKTETFKKEKAKAAKRKAAAKLKENQKWEWLDNLDIHLPKFTRPKLINRACDHYNARNGERARATVDSDKQFLERICVNYLRHCTTDYEEHLEEIKGKVGVEEAYQNLRQKIFREISRVYPWLAEECKRQQDKYGFWSWGKFQRSLGSSSLW